VIDPKFNNAGLIPVIAQDYRTGEIRMMAWANREALKKTLETGYAHYFSRSRGKVWKKGETSGEVQRVREVRIDCDEDALIYVIEQNLNKACHTGERNCFFRSISGEKVSKPLPFEALFRLQEILKDRIEKKPPDSYTVQLVESGTDRVLQKFGEEAIECLIAFKNGIKKDIVSEAADMLYVFILALTLTNTDIKEVMEKLIERMR